MRVSPTARHFPELPPDVADGAQRRLRGLRQPLRRDGGRHPQGSAAFVASCCRPATLYQIREHDYSVPLLLRRQCVRTLGIPLETMLVKQGTAATDAGLGQLTAAIDGLRGHGP